jgi:TonB-linked SusC/RagA family outer membrane protein
MVAMPHPHALGRVRIPRTGRSLLTRNLISLAIAAVATVGSARSVLAQGAVSGQVIAAGSGEAISNAQITAAGGTLRATSDNQGRFRITGVIGTNTTLSVRRIGYRNAEVAARVGQTDLTITLVSNPASLEAVVVTGTVGASQKREIGNSVGTIDAADIVANAPILSVQGLINGRAPSVVVMPTSGMVGSGQQLRIRGTASFSLGNNPLIYIDGVRVNNEVASGPVNQSFGSSSISRLNDLNPEDIESIEVLKGPSAATLYGTEASNGVVNVITKKGTGGNARWNVMLRQGQNYVQDWKSRFAQNWGIIPGTTTPVPLNMDSLEVGACGDSTAARLGRRCDIYRDGRHQESELAVSGGTGNLNYYLSGNLLDSQGADPNNDLRRYSTRMNLGLAATQTFRISANLGLNTGPTQLGCEGGCGGHTWTTLLATPANYNNPRRHGFHSLLPYQYDDIYHYWQNLDRFSGSLRFDHTPFTWFQQHLSLGLDRTREENDTYAPRIDSLVYTVGSDALGYRTVQDRSTTYNTIDYSASATYDAKPTLRFITSGGAQFYHNSVDYVSASGSVFPTPGLSTVQATTQSKTNDQDFQEDKTLGVYVQEQLGWRDRLFLTAALRSDDASAFGSGFNRVTYPKYSVSYVISDEPWFKVPVIGNRLSSLRLRAAYGEAGKAPSTYSALRTYGSASGPGDTPAVTPLFIGNPNLGPERGKEIELGFDASMLDDRLGIEYTYYNKKTVDAILNRQIAPSTGIPSTQPFNAGAIRNWGNELQVRANPLRTRNANLDLTFNFANNDNRVLALFDTVSFVNSGSFTRQAIGYDAFGFWERHVTGAKLDANGKLILSTLMCSNGKGGQVQCAGADNAFGTADDAPLVYLGRSVPPHEGSIAANLGLWSRFHVSTFVDFKQGHKKIDGNTRVRCTPVIGNRCRENFFPLDYDPITIAQMQNSNVVDFLITDAGFTKWREFTVSYDVPERFSHHGNVSRATVSLSGRNLHTWTKYQGFEPEAMWLGGTRGGNVAWEQTLTPQLTTWILSLNLGF